MGGWAGAIGGLGVLPCAIKELATKAKKKKKKPLCMTNFERFISSFKLVNLRQGWNLVCSLIGIWIAKKLLG